MITFDDAAWPLLTVTFAGKNSIQEFDAYLVKLTEYLKRGDRHITVLDARTLTTAPTLEQRQRQVTWIQGNLSLLRQRSLGNAFVITSPFIRLAMNIMYQLQPLPTPYTIVGDIKVAQSWATGQLRAAGIPPPREQPSRAGLG